MEEKAGILQKECKPGHRSGDPGSSTEEGVEGFIMGGDFSRTLQTLWREECGY